MTIARLWPLSRLYKSGSGIQGRVDCFTDGTTGTNNEIIPTTFSYTAGQWAHFDIRITPCAQGESTGAILLSVNGGTFAGMTNAAIDLTGSTDFRPKFGFYRGMGVNYGVPAGDSWVEHRTITGYIGTTNVLTWAGGLNGNTWDSGNYRQLFEWRQCLDVQPAGSGEFHQLIDQYNRQHRRRSFAGIYGCQLIRELHIFRQPAASPAARFAKMARGCLRWRRTTRIRA